MGPTRLSPREDASRGWRGSAPADAKNGQPRGLRGLVRKKRLSTGFQSEQTAAGGARGVWYWTIRVRSGRRRAVARKRSSVAAAQDRNHRPRESRERGLEVADTEPTALERVCAG